MWAVLAPVGLSRGDSTVSGEGHLAWRRGYYTRLSGNKEVKGDRVSCHGHETRIADLTLREKCLCHAVTAANCPVKTMYLQKHQLFMSLEKQPCFQHCGRWSSGLFNGLFNLKSRRIFSTHKGTRNQKNSKSPNLEIHGLHKTAMKYTNKSNTFM